MNFLSLQEHKFLEQYPATKLLLENNTQPSEGKNLAHYLAALGQVELLQQFLGLYPHNAVRQCKAGMSPLMEAVSKGHIDVVLFLLDNREGLKINLAARNCRGQTVLHISVNKQHRHITSILLSQGVLVDALDAKGNSALLCAVGGGFEQDSWLLIERHANVNLSTKGKLFTPLILAASLMKFDLCKVLLTNGARINEVDAKGRSALDYVVRARFKNEKLKQFENVAICDKVIKLFCNNGVDAQSLEQHLGAHIWAKDVHYAKLADAIYKLDMLQLRSLCGEKTMLPNFHRLLHACSQKFPKGIVSF
ncbi:MAG: ankyrin repeat protein 7 isoform, partial [Pseudomonadota bacterium]